MLGNVCLIGALLLSRSSSSSLKSLSDSDESEYERKYAAVDLVVRRGAFNLAARDGLLRRDRRGRSIVGVENH